jgi:peptide/nickel transport system substrate-binding protein
MKSKGYLLVLVLLMVLSLGLAGCNSSSETGGDKEPANNADPGKDNGTTGQSELIYGRSADATSLDPGIVTDGESFKVTQNIYDTLLQYGEKDTQVQEGLATKWEVTDDGKTYTLTLREGVKFHDGTDFNADAVVFNFERWMSGGSEDASFGYYSYMFGGFKGDEGHVIESVKALDDYTVEFKLKRPQAPFLKNLAMVPFGIASPTAVEEHGENYGKAAAVGTGPFVFSDWKSNDTITLKRNDNYWAGAPKLETVIFKVIPENSARLTALKTGEIDLMDGLNPSDVSQVESDSNLALFMRPGMNVAYFAFNHEKEPFDDPKVRQALNHAVNKQAIIDAFYAGNAKPAKNPMPDVIPGYNDEIEPYEYDLDKAKQLLEEAGYGDGFKMELWAMSAARDYLPEPLKIAEAMQADFEKLGIEVEIVTYDWTTYLEKIDAGEAQSFLLGWIGDNGDADNFLYVLLDQESGSNNANYKSDELHELLVNAQTETDENVRNELYKQAQEIIHEDAPWVPLVHTEVGLAGKSNLKGFVPHPTGTEKFTNAYFE